jgi:hypothetical protein
MGHVIALPEFPADYPEDVNDLNPAERTLLTGLRLWVADRQNAVDPMTRLCTTLDLMGGEDAAFMLDRFMTHAAYFARRVIAVACPRCPNLGDDEKHFLYAASLAQAGHGERAAVALGASMLTSDGAILAANALEDLCGRFAEAKLFLLRRRRPTAPADARAVLAWSPSPQQQRTVH